MQSYRPPEDQGVPTLKPELAGHDWELSGGGTSFVCRRCGTHGYRTWSQPERIVTSDECDQRVVREIMST